ncbi:MAG: outer membrane protein assembly factor BamD, partial [bacterium]|nr:outer membrane protein assembly factor BamD [Candidatus Kapabacteria bacterium]
RRWDDAIEKFDAASKAAPRTILAEESTIARADVQAFSGAFSAAADALLLFVAESPEALAADRALFRAADLIDRKLHETQRAVELYTRLLNEYPRSQHATSARTRIRELRNG